MPTITITKTYDDGQVLNESDLDNIKNGIETFLNTTKLDGDNLQLTTITSSLTATQANNVAGNMTAAGANSIFGTADSSHAISEGAANKILENASGDHTMDASTANTIFNRMSRTATSSTATSPNIAVSGSSGSFSTTSSTATAVTNLSVSLTTKGKPVVCMLVPFNAAAGGHISISQNGVDEVTGSLFMGIGANTHQFALASLTPTGSPSGVHLVRYAPGSFQTFDVISAGTHTFSVSVQSSSDNPTITVSACKLVAYEL